MKHSTKALQRALDRVKEWPEDSEPPKNVHLLKNPEKPAAQDSGNQK